MYFLHVHKVMNRVLFFTFTPPWICVMLGTLSNKKTFFIWYLTKYYKLLKNKVSFITTTWCLTLRFSSKASTNNNMFQIQCKGYVWPLQDLSVEFQIFKQIDIIIIDETIVMTTTWLQSVEIWLQQVNDYTKFMLFNWKLMHWISNTFYLGSKIRDSITCHMLHWNIGYFYWKYWFASWFCKWNCMIHNKVRVWC